MSIQVITEKGWTESIIDDNCNFDKFYAAAEIFQNKLNAQLILKLDGIDTQNWDFQINGNLLTLHYNIYLGISIYPTKFREATKEENLAVVEVGQQLFKLLQNN